MDFLRLLWAINHGLATTSRFMKTRFGITGRQRLIIRVVGEFPGISAGDLARVLHLDPSTLTGALQLMSRRGLLVLRSDQNDRRRLRLHLTPKGRRLGQTSTGAVEAAVSRTLARVPASKVKVTRDVLSLLAENLDRREGEVMGGDATSD
jgi:DNA-binding MarR family transcriptional regulator